MDKKVFELVIDEDDDSGVSMIAIVDAPAIERDFHKFNKSQSFAFKVADEDKRIAPTIEKIVNKFMKQGLNAEINLMHESEVSDVYVFESLIIDKDRGINAPDGFKDAPDGSWFVSMRVDNDELWNDIKQGTYRGFSVEGMFAKADAMPTDEQIIDAAIDAING
jgi:hypothetical protein